MFPINDTVQHEKFPIVNWILIIINAIVFFFELSLDEKAIEELFLTYGLVPSDFTNANKLNPVIYIPFISNIFLHGGWGHFIGNMWTLFIFGDNVEDRMGRFRYLLFYLICGALASATHYYLYQASTIPSLGASGAISGVMGAYLFLFPKSRIIFFIPVLFIPFFIPIPAFIYLIIWFAGQFLSGTYTLFHNVAAGIAFWAHIGGFLSGVLIHWIFVKRKRRYRPKYKTIR